MGQQTFSEWLGDRVGTGTGKLSKRELARRLAHQSDGTAERVEAQRRNVRRILNGQRATQTTRNMICDALDVPRVEAPSVEDEDEESSVVETLTLALLAEVEEVIRGRVAELELTR